MGSSLRAGLGALDAVGVDAVVVTLVDTPGVGSEHVRRLLAAVDRSPAVVAAYGGAPRTPVLLRRAVWGEVAAAAVGDVGARAWTAAHPDRVVAVECADLGPWRDVDVPADLDAVRRPGA
jgi:CTP:molybdopterin cytidylyltransferase MocA